MKHYYIPFDLSLNVNYNYIISLYDIAEFNNDDKCYNIIHYGTQKRLAELLNISNKTLIKMLDNNDYNLFFSIDKKCKTIYLNNNFKNTKGKNKRFVFLLDKEVEVLKKYNDNMLYKYYLYVKYFCGLTNNKQDFTAKQFLAYCGYSVNSNNYISKVSEYNSILTENKLIRIKKYRDEMGYTRNVYSIF